ncbi:MAG: flagellin [Planctomycetota bacterium]
MSTIPPGLARVPNSLRSQLSLSSINKSQLALLQVQEQLSTARMVNRVSDDPVRAALIGVLDDKLDRSVQRSRNISHAQAALGEADNALAEINDLGLSAQEIASNMVGTGFSSGDRAAQATIVQSILDGMLSQATRQSAAGYILGGDQPGQNPIQHFRGGYRFTARGNGIVTDINLGRSVPITLGGTNPVGSTSGRVKGDVDFNPDLTAGTRLSDLSGGRGLGVSLGTLEFSFNAGTKVQVDLTGADTADDITKRLNQAIRAYETTNSVTVLGPGGVSVSGAGFSVDVVAGGSLQFSEVAGGVTAQDLGLTAAVPFAFTSATPSGVDLNAKLTWTTPVSAMTGLGGALGTIRVKNVGGFADVDLSGATTLQDIRNRIEGTNLGVRVVINDAGTGIDVLNEVAGTRAMAMSIEEVSGNTSTATRLGIRSFSGTTQMSDFNDGRGVRIIDGVIDPTTGTATTLLNSDLSITLGDGASTVIAIDLTPADMTTVQTVLTAMNAQIAAQLATAGLAPGDCSVGLAADGNGLVINQNAAFASPVSVGQLNNSQAAADLGLMGGAYDSTSSSFVGTDTATVRVDNLFTHLIDLRDALNANDTSGIALASEGMSANLDRLTEVRGLVGGYQQRVDSAQQLEEDQTLVDTSVRSDLRDVNYAEAATRLSQLQAQLTAGYQSSSATLTRTLLDFLQ